MRLLLSLPLLPKFIDCIFRAQVQIKRREPTREPTAEERFTQSQREKMKMLKARVEIPHRLPGFGPPLLLLVNPFCALPCPPGAFWVYEGAVRFEYDCVIRFE